MPRVNYPFMVSVDWLQLYCGLAPGNRVAYNAHPEYKYEPAEYGTPQYFNKTTFYFRTTQAGKPYLLKVGYILFNPRLSSMPKDSCHVHINNAVLYRRDWFAIVCKFIRDMGLTYRGITRIDLCYDCNKFYGGLSPDRLIKGLITQKYLKIGVNRGYLNFDDLGYVVPTNTAKQNIELNLKEAPFTGITFGARSSGTQTQIYNKSLELARIKYKPYIVQAWEEAGLDVKNVWRTEIRVMARGKQLFDLETSDMFNFGLSEVMDQDAVERMFLAYAEKCTRIVKRDYHVKRQQMKAVKLYCCGDGKASTLKPKIIRNQTTATRTITVVTNAMDRLALIHEYDMLPNTIDDIRSKIRDVSRYFRANFTNLCAPPKGSTTQKWYTEFCQRIIDDRASDLYEQAQAHSLLTVPKSYKSASPFGGREGATRAQS